MRYQPSIFTSTIVYLVVLIAFLEVWNHWAKKPLLALFFLIVGVAVLLFNTYELWRYNKNRQAIEEMDCLNKNR